MAHLIKPIFSLKGIVSVFIVLQLILVSCSNDEQNMETQDITSSVETSKKPSPEQQIENKQKESQKAEDNTAAEQKIEEEDLNNSSFSLISRSLDAGPVVFLVLFTLIFMSILTWAILLTKFFSLRSSERRCRNFIDSFWNSRSLNELNNKLSKHPYSPARELFRTAYSELLKGNQLKEQSSSQELAIASAMDNLKRSLNKSKITEKRLLESYLPFLAISASAAPFIGLFGTVWGIMTAFEGIAQSGSSSLASVAPGISEALIATAFGLAAAIPAVVGYNISHNLIRSMSAHLDTFGMEFLNIAGRFLVGEKGSRQESSANSEPTARI